MTRFGCQMLSEGVLMSPRAHAALETSFTWGPYQVKNELAAFAQWCDDHVIQHVIEIGMHHGGTTALFLALGCTVVGVDLPDGPYGGLQLGACVARNDKLTAAYPKTFIGLLGDSHDPLMQEAVGQLMPKADLVFIDGDHAAYGVSRDYEHYKPLVRKGGYMAFHDITPAKEGYGVPAFWASLDGSKTTIRHEAAEWGGIGIVQVT